MDAQQVVDFPKAGAGAAMDTGSFMALTFDLDGELFAIAVRHVQEVIDPLEMTIVPNADPFAPGLINVRGAVVPVLDLQQRLGLRKHEQTADSRFIVFETTVRDDRAKFAIVADGVHEVFDADRTTIQPSPDLGLRWPSEFIHGITRKDGKLLIFLNAEMIFQPDPLC